MTTEKNLIIQGDNLSVMEELVGDLEGSVDLIYIDPPFNTGRDFKDYKDSWGGLESYLEMMRPRLILMRELLSETGSIYVHCDWRTNSYLRILLDEIFGKENFINEIIWAYKGPSPVKTHFPKKHDTIFYYGSKKSPFNWKDILIPYSDNTLQRRTYSETKKSGIAFSGKDISEYEQGKIPQDWWDDIHSGGQISCNELQGYPTQKPEALLERIIKASSNKGDLVADFFCGSGTTGAVAERLGRRWIMCDIGDRAVEVTKKRLSGSEFLFFS